MSRKLCILQLTGVRPFKSKKYDITKHKRYKLLKDYDPKNNFDIEKFLKKRQKIHVLDVERIARNNPNMKVETQATYEVNVAG